MIYEEARKHFGLKESDPISESGVKEILKSSQEQLKVWSIGASDRASLNITIEACKALLRGIEK